MEKQNEHEYQGWTNYETWTVSLWLDNEESSYRYWRSQADRHRREAATSQEVREGIWTSAEGKRFHLADQLRDEIGGAAPLNDASLYSDLLTAALSEVDWLAIADNLLDE